MPEIHDANEARSYRRAIALIAAMVLAIGFGETAYGLAMDSRFLIRDGLEWAYDAVIYTTAAAAFGRGARAERLAAFALAAVLIGAGLVTIGQIWLAFVDPPQVEPFNITLAGALVVAEAWAVVGLLWRFRRSHHPVIEATWLSARNDAATSTLYALVMMAARFSPDSWPQMVVDAVSAMLCLQAGAKILRELIHSDARSDEAERAVEEEGVTT